MAVTAVPEAKKQKVEGAARPARKFIYIVRWHAPGSEVDEWDGNELDNIETTCDDVEEAKAYITGEIDCGDALLQADGLRRDEGTFGTAFSTIDGACEGLKQCHDARVAKMRGAIRHRLGIDGGLYVALLDQAEINEHTHTMDGAGTGKPPYSAKVHNAPGTLMETDIVWGATGQNAPDQNRKDQHEFIRCLECVTTRVTCWIESLELE